MDRRGPIALITSFTAVLFISLWRLRGPTPQPPSAPADRFSAGRAVAVLRHLLQEQRPHPVGTPANAVVRDRILVHFRDLGYEPTLQRSFVCNAATRCATVENILVMPQRAAEKVILLTAHHDSVAAGPGASDDGVGVAVVLEIARAERGNPRIAFLITDGEEPGLLGAEAFVADRATANRVGVIVNVENRGTSGPSYLFETTRGNLNLIRAARSMPTPITTSLFFTIYDQLPNDTDVTVFKRAGLQAVNFGAIGHVHYYHTPLDDLAHVDARTVQHHGDNALFLARALAARPDRPAQENAVWFDILGFTMVLWPQRWTLWIAIISLALLLLVCRRSPLRSVIIAVLAFVVALLLAGMSAFALGWLSHLRSGGDRLAYPQPFVAAVWVVTFAAVFFVTRVAERWADTRALLLGYGLVCHVAAILLAATLPGASYLFLVPGALLSISLLARLPEAAASVIAATAAAALCFPFALVMYTAMVTMGASIASFIVLPAALAAPLMTRWRALIVALAVLAVAGTAVTAALPVYTKSRPRRDPIRHELPAPTLELTGTRAEGRFVVMARSNRNADQVRVAFEGNVHIDRVNGARPAPANPRGASRPRRAVTVYGKEAVIEGRAVGAVTVTGSDLTYGAPPDLVRRRPANAVTSGTGDVTVSERKMTF